ncbi:MAG: alpha-E domain-containing protein [Pseudomonadota bacterium]
MTMLSRVTDRLYWTARYLERAEDTARLTQSYTHLIMDIPEGYELGWQLLVQILDAETQFREHYRAFNEQNVLRFMIAEPDNGSSLFYCINQARENVRTTRDVLPEEAWELVNELYLYALEYAERSVGRRNRHRFLDQIIARCQMINGMMMSTLYRDHAYRFTKLGHLLERADMTTRIIDVGAAALLADRRHHDSFDSLIWACILRSLSAMGSYRRIIGPIIEVNDVIDFVFREPGLPRSTKFCLDGIRKELVTLKHNEEAMRVLERCRRSLSRFDVRHSDRDRLHAFIDRLQLNLNTLNDTITNTWFLPQHT